MQEEIMDIATEVQHLICARSWLKVNLDSLNNIKSDDDHVKGERIKLLDAIEVIDKIIYEKLEVISDEES